MRILSTGLASLLMLVAVGSAGADEKAGRYSMSPTDGGFLRLDTQTGAVSFCNRRNEQWNCTGIADEPQDLRLQIDKLKARNLELEAEVKRLDEMLGIREGDAKESPDRRAERPSLPNLQLPSEQDVDKALDYLSRMFRKFRDKLKDLDDPERKGTKI